MSVRRLLTHTGVVAAGILLLIGLPLHLSGFFYGIFGLSGPDAVSGASIIVDRPSGQYVVLMNKAFHPDSEKLADWERFFSGEEVSYFFEDIACDVPSGDTGGMEMARSFQSRLPENQMSVRTEDLTLLMSRADHGLFDVLILSREYADIAGTDSLSGDAVLEVDIASEAAGADPAEGEGDGEIASDPAEGDGEEHAADPAEGEGGGEIASNPAEGDGEEHAADPAEEGGAA